MNNFLVTIQDGLRRVRKVWVIAAVVILALVLGVAAFATGTIERAVAAFRGESAVASVSNQVVVTSTMPALPGMVMETPTAIPAMPGMVMETPTAMPGMVMETPATGNVQPSGGDLDALTLQMQEMMQSLQGMMGQLDQKGTTVYVQPTAVPTAAIDMQPIMAEMQSINQEMGPLMLRIQADLQGNPSAEELASVRAQVMQINTRIGNLVNQIQMARGNAMPGMAAAPTAMPGMSNIPGMGQYPSGSQGDPSQAAMSHLDEMMKQMDAMLYQMQTGNMTSQPGTMPGMSNIPPAGPMAGTVSSNPSMDDMMKKMDDMMSMMDGMMGMGGMTMPSPTAMPGMSSSDPSMKTMDDMMMMMDNMMMMMDDMMKMGMPDM